MICEQRQYPFMQFPRTFAGMTDTLKRRLQKAGRNQEELAEALNISPWSASRLVRGQRTMKALEATRIDTWLAETASDQTKDGPSVGGKIPLYGYAAGSSPERVAFTSSRALDWIDGPPHQVFSGPVAALRVAGDSMEPRLFAGEEVLIALDLPPARGRDCVLEFKDGTAAVKTYEKSRDGWIFCRQYNPDSEVRFAASEVKAVHAVLWRK